MPSISEVLVLVDCSLFSIPCVIIEIDLVYNIFENNPQLAMFRGFPFVIMIMKNKFDGVLPPFLFLVPAIKNLMNVQGPYMYIRSGKQGNKPRYVCFQVKRQAGRTD